MAKDNEGGKAYTTISREMAALYPEFEGRHGETIDSSEVAKAFTARSARLARGGTQKPNAAKRRTASKKKAAKKDEE